MVKLFHSMRFVGRIVLWAGLALTTAEFTFAQSVVINEIMYHPLQPQFGAEPLGEEFIELFNSGSNAVNLTGWRLSKGVDFAFTNVTLAPRAYLVVSPNIPAFTARYPGV